MGEGSVYRRKDGRWCAKWKDASGAWRYRYRKSKAEAKAALREALKDRDDNIVPATRSPWPTPWTPGLTASRILSA